MIDLHPKSLLNLREIKQLNRNQTVTKTLSQRDHNLSKLRALI